MNYDFPQKEHWRRCIWNDLRKECPVPPKESVILYLAGEQDLDRIEAKKKGFYDYNLIAVENDKKVYEKLYQKGIPVIYGELKNVIWNWPREIYIDGVLADFMSGLERNAVVNTMWRILFSPSVRVGAFCMANMLRGRERNNPWVLPGEKNGDLKHRGVHLMAELSLAIVRTLGLPHSTLEEEQYSMNKVIDLFRPYRHSYKSGIQLFDSVIIERPNLVAVLVEGEDEKLKTQINKVLSERCEFINI